jgi:hypothetical protein
VAHPKHEQVRQRFEGACGYCGVKEVDVGGQLVIDHYLPIAAGGTDDDENLVYCCFRCNLYKGDFAPDPSDLVAKRAVLHPLKDSFDEHLWGNESTGILSPLTETGRFHQCLLHLNRPELVAYRLRRRALELGQARQQLLESEISELRAIIAAQERYLEHLRKLLGRD